MKITVLVPGGRVELGSYDARVIEFIVRPVNSFSKSLYFLRGLRNLLHKRERKQVVQVLLVLL